MKYLFYPGCNAEQVEKEALESTLAVCSELGIELEYAEDFSCCGATHVDKVDDFLNVLVNARNFAKAEAKGLDVMTICNTCFIVMKRVQNRLAVDHKLLQDVNVELGKLGLCYQGTSCVSHFIDMIDEYGIDELQAKVVREVPLKVAPFYGCHLLRPVGDTGRSEPETEQIVDEILETLGCDVVNYDRESSCCGFHVTMANPGLCSKLNGWNMLNAKDAGADVIVTPCTLCHTVMDGQQHRAEKQIGERICMPVLHLPQLVGLALGIDAAKLGLKRHVVPCRDLLLKLQQIETERYEPEPDMGSMSEELDDEISSEGPKQ